MVIGVDLTKRGGRAAAKAIESNQAKVNQKNDELIREACGGSTLQNAYLNWLSALKKQSLRYRNPGN